MFTEELFEVYLKYEKAVHGKDREKPNLERFLCNSPLFDPNDPNEDYVNRLSEYGYETLDEQRTFKDEGVYPGYGTFHMYHRIDDKVVAIGVIDITKTIFNSAYFLYDPEYSFLCLGVVGAIRELEYIRLI